MGGFSYSPSLLAQLSSVPLLLGVEESSKHCPCLSRCHHTRWCVAWVPPRPPAALPAHGSSRSCPPRRRVWPPERLAGGSVPSPRARAAAATAAPVMSGRSRLPKHGCESGAAFPPVFGWSGTSRDRRRLSRLSASADALGLAVLSRHSRGSLPHAVTASTPLGFGTSLEAGSLAGVCPLLDVPKATDACGLHLLTPRKALQQPRRASNLQIKQTSRSRECLDLSPETPGRATRVSAETQQQLGTRLPATAGTQLPVCARGRRVRLPTGSLWAPPAQLGARLPPGGVCGSPLWGVTSRGGEGAVWDGMEQDEAGWDETGWDGMGSHTPAGRQLGMLLGWQHLDADPGSSGAGPGPGWGLHSPPSSCTPCSIHPCPGQVRGTKTQRGSGGMGTEGLLRTVNVATVRGCTRGFWCSLGGM